MKNFFQAPQFEFIGVRNDTAFKKLKRLTWIVPILSAFCLSVFLWLYHPHICWSWALLGGYFFLTLAITLLARRFLNTLAQNFELSHAHLKQSEEHFRLLANSIPELISVSTGEGEALWYNDAWYRYTGSSPNEKFGINWRHVHHPNHFPVVFEKWKNGIQKGTDFEIQFPLKGSDGVYRRFHYRATPIKDKKGKITFWFGTCADIETEMTQVEDQRFLKEATAALNSSLEMETILRLSSDYTVNQWTDLSAVCFVVPEEPTRIISHYAPSMGNSKAQEEISIGQLSDLVSKIDWNLIREGKWQILSSKQVGVSFLGQMGLDFFAAHPLFLRNQLLGVYLFFLKSGKVFHPRRLKMLTEFTALCTNSLNNAQLHLDLKEAVETRDDFISVASHELKTPLTSLQLQIQSLDRKITASSLKESELAGLTRFCVDQTLRISHLINQLFDTTQIRIGKIQLQKLQTNLSYHVEEVCRKFQSEAKAKGVGFEWSGNEAIIGCWDPLRLEQIITNLLSNALKYGAGKPISIKTKVLDNQTHAMLSIRDRGCGIPESMQSKIFERFSRGSAEPHTRGLGLGLFICRQLVQAHRGKIEVKSTLGEG
ncbi:PAS domain S-box protein, partial [bacterium]|nr:PAS domain S-box protein [bacterium]